MDQYDSGMRSELERALDSIVDKWFQLLERGRVRIMHTRVRGMGWDGRTGRCTSSHTEAALQSCISSSLCTNVSRWTSSGPEVSRKQKGKEVLSGRTRCILEYAAVGYAEVITDYGPYNK